MQHTNRPKRDVRRVVFSLAILAAFGLLAQNGCPPPTIQETKLLASDGAPLDEFGSSLSLGLDVAVIGAPSVISQVTGAAYVYRFDEAEWVEEAKLIPLDGAIGSGFGYSVAVSGTFVMVGAFYDTSGSVYVYSFDGTSWVEDAKLLASDGASSDQFGRSVSVSGDVALVGAPRADNNGDRSGSAYVYRFDGTSWVEEAKLLASDGASSDQFGRSVSVSGDVAVVGAWADDENGKHSGSAYAYRFDGAEWVEEVKLLAPHGMRYDRFGYSVSISGNVAVVGTAIDDRPGAAYVYRFDGSNWLLETTLPLSDEPAEARFGQSVSAFGNFVTVGSFLGADNGEKSGTAYVYRFNGTGWETVAKLLPTDGVAEDRFGFQVAVMDDTVLAGAIFDGDNGREAGSAYVFSPLSGTPACGDGRDNDGDTFVDLGDPGCAIALDTSEHTSLVECDDGRDNDNDAKIDYPDDLGCRNPVGVRENPQCQDGINNDPGQDALIDFDGGQSIHGECIGAICPEGVSDPDGDGVADPDPDCIDRPWWNNEMSCGLGFELALILPGLMWLHRRRRRLH